MFGNLVYWHDPSLVHPDDRARLDQMCGGLSFHCYEVTGVEDEYLVIAAGGETFRVKDAAIRQLPSPKFAMGMRVRTTNGTPRRGWIAGIGWHFKEGRHLYQLEVEGRSVSRRRISRRYGEEDLEIAE